MVLVAAVAAQFAFLAYAVFGGFLAWRWPRTIALHLAGALWLIVIVVARLTCPLTWIEDRMRERIGAAPTNGFLDHYVAGVFYPTGREDLARIAVAVIVGVSWIGFALRRRRAGATRQDQPVG